MQGVSWTIKTLTSQYTYDTIFSRMEVGLFFMPKNRWGRIHHRKMNRRIEKARWKLCAQESHWNVRNVNTVTTT